jgi:hypothetical protein
MVTRDRIVPAGAWDTRELAEFMRRHAGSRAMLVIRNGEGVVVRTPVRILPRNSLMPGERPWPDQ